MNHEWTASLHFLRHCSNLQKKLRYPHLPLVDKDFEVLVKKKKVLSPFFPYKFVIDATWWYKIYNVFLIGTFISVRRSSETDSASWFLDRYKLGLYNAFKHIYYMFIICFLREKDLLLLNFSIKKLSCSCWQC